MKRNEELLMKHIIEDMSDGVDRPYKPPMAPEKAFSILEDMAEHGKLDPQLLSSFRESNAWKKELEE